MRNKLSPEEFGREIAKVVQTDEAYEILGPLIAPKPNSWSRGGCCALALALQQIRPSQLRMVVRRSRPVHVVYVDGDIYIDAEGPQTIEELEMRWSLPSAPARVKDLDPDLLERADIKCPHPEPLVEYLNEHLRIGSRPKVNPGKSIPINSSLYERVKSEARLKFDVYPSIYANSWVVREYKRRGGRYRGDGAGLTKWYEEKWVDLARSTDSSGRIKKWHECGRPKAGKRSYPKCVPLAKARAMSPKERRSAIRRKREAERKTPLRSKSGDARSPKMVRTNPMNRESNKRAKKAIHKVQKLEHQMEASKKGAVAGSAIGGVVGFALGPVGALTAGLAGNYIGGKIASRRANERFEKEHGKSPGSEPKPNPNPFYSRPHNWDEVLIHRDGKKITRGQILGHYMKHRAEIWPFLKNQHVMVIFAPSKNKFVRRRNDPSGNYIKLTKLTGVDDPGSFEYWIKRRVIEFHPTLMGKRTRLVWVDMDAHESKGRQALAKARRKMKSCVPKTKAVLRKLGVKGVHVYDSGTGGGIHVEGSLTSPRDVDSLRKKLREALHEAFIDDPDVVVMGSAHSGQVKLDTSTLHRLGSLRAPFSMTVEGGYKKPI